jgi:hypothetical protein
MAIIRISIQYLNQDALCGLRKIMEGRIQNIP